MRGFSLEMDKIEELHILDIKKMKMHKKLLNILIIHIFIQAKLMSN